MRQHMIGEWIVHADYVSSAQPPLSHVPQTQVLAMYSTVIFSDSADKANQALDLINCLHVNVHEATATSPRYAGRLQQLHFS